MNKNDILWKAILEDIFDDFLCFFYPNANEIFDFARGFEYLDKELEQLFPPEEDQYEPRYVDKLVKVYTKEGQEECILVHIEVKGYADKYFSKRMFTYYSRILDKYDKQITAFAIFTDDDPNFLINKFERDYLGTKLTYTYNTYKIIEQPDDILLKSNNPFALVAITVKTALQGKQMEEWKLYDLKLDLARRLLDKKIPKEKIRSLMNFLRFYIRFDNSKMERNFEKDVEALTQKNTTMGIEEFLLERAKKEGIEKGIEKGILEERKRKNTEIAQNLKKAGVDTKIIAEATGLSLAEIENL